MEVYTMIVKNRVFFTLFSLVIPVGAMLSQPLTQVEVDYVTRFTTNADKAVQRIVTLVTNFIDLHHKQPISLYTAELQKELQVFKQLINDLKMTIKQQPDSRYKVMLQDAKELIEAINVGLVVPIYKCLVGKKTRTRVSPEDRSEMLAAALKISIDEFNATSSKEIIIQFKKLHAFLTNFGLTTIAETVKNVVELLVQSQSTQPEVFSEDQKKTIKAAILLKLQLDN
jgi:hypothetical protein